MSRPLLILRPEPGNRRSVARAEAMGLAALACPLFEIGAMPWEPPPPGHFDAVLFTSANAVKCAGPALSAYVTLPAICVGESTAEAARLAGFADVTIGSGDVSDLLDGLGKRTLLHLCGEDVTETQFETIERRTVYASQIIDHPPSLTFALALHPVAALHSVRAAKRFADLVDSSDSQRAAICLATLSTTVAAAAGGGWQEVAIAAKPRDEDLLDVAMRLIQHIKAPALP